MMTNDELLNAVDDLDLEKIVAGIYEVHNDQFSGTDVYLNKETGKTYVAPLQDGEFLQDSDDLIFLYRLPKGGQQEARNAWYTEEEEYSEEQDLEALEYAIKWDWEDQVSKNLEMEMMGSGKLID